MEWHPAARSGGHEEDDDISACGARGRGRGYGLCGFTDTSAVTPLGTGYRFV